MATSNEPLTTITIALPATMAAKAEALAESEGRTLSELFLESFRDYASADALRTLEDIRRYAQTRNPHGYTEADVPRLIKEARAQMAAEEGAQLKAAKAS
jgi:hypothetical protein